MEKIRAIIVEDEPLAAELIAEYLEKVPFIENYGAFHDPVTAYGYLQEQNIELIFLDIHLPGLNGLDFLKSLEEPPQVILTTAYHQYALESYDYAVVDYLLKPIEYDRFAIAVGKVKQKVQRNYLTINVNKSRVRIDVGTICYIESMRDYLMVHINTTERHKTKMTIAEMESRLSANFVRIHRSFLVNKEYVTAINAQQCKLGDTILPVGRSYKQRIRAAFYLEE